MVRYSLRQATASSSLRSGQTILKMSSRGRPVIRPTTSNSSAAPPRRVMTWFAVSTTKRTLSVSVPSRSQQTSWNGPGLRSGSALALAGAGADRDRRHLDRKLGLLGDLAVTRHLAAPIQRGELVAERREVVELRVDDAEPDVAHRVDVGETLEDHLADPLRAHFRHPALPEGGLDVVDERAELLGREALRGGLLDRARQLAPVELLAAAVALLHLDAGRFAPLERGEPRLAPIARPAAPDGRPILRLA